MKLEFISAKGDILPLTNNDNFKLSNVDGITLADADISSSTVASMDGDFVNNVRVIPRTVILDLAIERPDVETVKRDIMRYIKPRQRGILHWTQDGRTVQMVGIVQSIEMARFSALNIMQVTLYCSQPFWEDIENTVQDISEILDMHYFTDYVDDMLYFTDEGAPFGEYDLNRTKAFDNTGDVEVGLEIHIVALGEVKNPVIYNSAGEFIGIDITMHAADEAVITTAKGHKSITVNGVNKMANIREKSTWLQLPTGEEEFTIASDDETESNMYFTVVYKQRYV